MLQSTFIHIPGVGREKEKMFWRKNIHTWDDYLENYNFLQLGENTKEIIRKNCIVSKKQYELGNFWHFSENLPLNEHWRAYPDCIKNCCFLDIETTGLDKQNNKITTIGVYDGQESRVFVRGRDMDKFRDYIQNYSMIVTFNGRCFDLPFIKNNYPEICFNQFHIDLRFVMKELGYTGGLKRIEKEMGITRNDEIAEVDGFEAVRLWRRYKKGDNEALRKLIEYNIADVENLKIMMDMVFEKLREKLTIFHNESFPF